MKKILFVCSLFFIQLSLISQPLEFSWTNRHYLTHSNFKFNYISSAKDQKQQGTCNIFSSVAAVEAMAQIYFNKRGAALDLSESYVYSKCMPVVEGCDPASVPYTLDFFKSSGVIDELTLPFPTTPTDPPNDCYYLNSCYTGPASYRVKIPEYHTIKLNNSNSLLERAIIDHGPIIACMNENFSGVYHGATGIRHTVLIVGWQQGTSNIKWQIKDSWPGNPSLDYHEFNMFTYQPTFYYIIPDTTLGVMNCTGTGCGIFSNRTCEDNDGDGFYNWGIGPKPSSLTNAPSKMDYNDDDANTISLGSDYKPQSAPTITVPSGPICSSGDSLLLKFLPSGFTATWSVSPSSYFSGTTSGNGKSAFVTPLSSEIMKPCYVTFTIHETGTSWTKDYVKNFIINGPDPTLITTSVQDSYGHTPPNMSGIWLLCPNTTYYIYLNNSSSTCATSDYTWTTPTAWTQYYHYSNYVSIYTGTQPSGTVDIYAKTCCSLTSRVKIKTQNFSRGNCGNYLTIYPNPASEIVTILLTDDFDTSVKDKSLEIFDANSNSKYKLKEFSKENTIETGSWKDGFYYVKLRYNGNDFTYTVRITH